MADAYAYEQQDSQEIEDQAKQIGRCVAKLKGSSRNSQLRVLAGLLEQLSQDVEALGPHLAREALLKALHDTAILHSKQKDVRMYAAACFAQLLRIYAPDTPYEEQKQLEVRHTARPHPPQQPQQPGQRQVAPQGLCLRRSQQVFSCLAARV